MKSIKKYFLLFLYTALLFYGCSSTTRYSRTNNYYGKDLDVKNLNVLGVETGMASYYADEFDGKKTAAGEIYDMNEPTAAHPSYPFNTIVKVTNLFNGKSVEVRINDRMPDFKGRVIDLSLSAAKKIDMIKSGIQEVKLEVIKWGNKKLKKTR